MLKWVKSEQAIEFSMVPGRNNDSSCIFKLQSAGQYKVPQIFLFSGHNTQHKESTS